MSAKFEDDDDFTPGKKGDPKKADTKKPTSFENEADLDCDWGDSELMKRKDPLPRIRPEKGKAVRFALLPYAKPKKAFNHYIEKKGTFRCLSNEDGPGVCCESGVAGNSNLSIVALAVKYTNCDPKSGKYEGKHKVPDTEFELGYVSLSRSNYTAINKLVEDEETSSGTPESVYDFDIIMTHNENTGIGYTLSRASRTPRWRKDEGTAKEVKAAAEPFSDGKLLTAKLGRKLTVIEWKAMLAGLNGDAEGEVDGDDL